MMSKKAARRIILDLTQAGYYSALVDRQDSGKHVDLVFSCEPGHESEIMTLAKSERLTDPAIRNA